MFFVAALPYFVVSRSPTALLPYPPTALAFGIQERSERILEVGVPARQRRAVLDDVADGPGHAFLVGRALGLVVGAQDVEIAARQAFEHEVDDLLAGPGAGRLFRRARRQAGIGEAGNEKMRRN